VKGPWDVRKNTAFHYLIAILDFIARFTIANGSNKTVETLSGWPVHDVRADLPGGNSGLAAAL
jgi:hypothetical protein